MATTPEQDALLRRIHALVADDDVREVSMFGSRAIMLNDKMIVSVCKDGSLLVRVADPNDRRALHIHLTEAGIAMWRDVDQCGQRVRERALRDMDDATRTQLTRLLEQVRDNLVAED